VVAYALFSILWEVYPLWVREFRISPGRYYSHKQCRRPGAAALSNTSSPVGANVSLLLSYFSEEGGRAGEKWQRIAHASLQNHIAFARATGVPYKRAAHGHPRCGKLRHIQVELALLPETSWLWFLDADAGMTACKKHVMPLSEYVSRWHDAVWRYDGLDVDMLILKKFGMFAVRNSAWSRDYVRRLADAVEGRKWLCDLSLPENWAFFEATTVDDFCHIHEVAYAEECFIWKDREHDISLVHMHGSEVKKSEAVASFVSLLDQQSRCFSEWEEAAKAKREAQVELSWNNWSMSWVSWEPKEIFLPLQISEKDLGRPCQGSRGEVQFFQQVLDVFLDDLHWVFGLVCLPLAWCILMAVPTACQEASHVDWTAKAASEMSV